MPVINLPTRFYKTGVVFMAWLNGHQDYFTMVGGQQSARSLQDPDMACTRMRALLATQGVV